MNEDIEFPAPAAVQRLRTQLQEADGIWFFSPEYNHGISGVLKNFLDWMSRPDEAQKRVLNGKAAAVSGITPGMSGTLIAQDQLVTLLSFLNYEGYECAAAYDTKCTGTGDRRETGFKRKRALSGRAVQGIYKFY